MPKKRPADKLGGGRAFKLPRRPRKHLYLVVDDWKRGYSIRKLDLSSDWDSDDIDDRPITVTTEQRLPPAVFRLDAPRAHSGLFAAFGTMIVATQLTPRGTIPMFDVRTLALTFGPRQESQPNPCCTDFLQVGGNLYFIDNICFMMLDPPPPPPKNPHPYIEIDWTWRGLPEPPFDDCPVSHAVHPDGRTIFFSTQQEQTQKHTGPVATFTFDTVRSQWTRRGAWRLPFRGCGYFDRELNAWVGLSGDPDTLGHLCSCEVKPTDADGTDGPTWKLSKEKLFCVDPSEKHIGATLVHMGGRSMFCLVQCLSIDDRKGDVWEDVLPERLCYLLRVTTFSLRYDMIGDLQAAVRRVRSYRLPKIATEYCDHLEKPVAFWM